MTASAQPSIRRRGAVRRCPACGHRFDDPAPPTCDLCGFDVDGGSATGADLTPYAQAYARRERGWFRMLEWVWFASGDRIRHAALMRSSAASRRFAQTNCFLLALAGMVVELTGIGWHDSTVGQPEPSGASGWIQFATRAAPATTDATAPHGLWWNVAQATIAGSLGLFTALLTIWVTLVVLSWLIEKVHAPPYRGEYRMTAAVHYATAWASPILIGALVLGLLPIARAGDLVGWSWAPSPASVLIAGGAVVGLGVCLAWFWLVRVSASAPVRTRSRVVVFFAVGLPLIVGGAVCGWHFGLLKVCEVVFPLFDLKFA